MSQKKFASRPHWLLTWLGCAAFVCNQAFAAEVNTIFDLNPDNGRSDVLTRGTLHWPIKAGPACSIEHEQITLELKAENRQGGEGSMAFGWWKAGYDFGSTLASDGVVAAEGNDLVLTIRGLSPGKHTLTTWHNYLDAQAPSGRMIVLHHGQHSKIAPSHRVEHDDDSTTCTIEFQVEGSELAVFRFRPDDAHALQQSAIINAIALDIEAPAHQTRRHQPANGDLHVVQQPTLKWSEPLVQTSQALPHYDVYLGTSAANVALANHDSPEFRGSTQSLDFLCDASDCTKDYYWRVDTLTPDKKQVAGRVNHFKIRHLAFPEAEGFGRFAIGGRGGRVLEVTNLNDSGPGSLRAAVEASGPRTIVFRVSGTIKLESKLIIREPMLTIAGQTAPGQGICVRGFTFGCLGTHDVIMRHIRIRVGDEAGVTMDGTGFASTDHSIFDHCSISWSIDEAVSSRSAKNITLQRCIVSEALNIAGHRKYEDGKGHSFAGSISGDIGSFHHNLLAHCAGRNWSLAGGLTRGGKFAGRLDIRNNVVYNWQHRTNDGGVKALNLVNNLYLPGPATKVFHLLKPDVGSPDDPQQYFVSGNSMEGRFGPESNWQDAVQVAPDKLAAIRLNEPFCDPHVITHSTQELLDNVLTDVGANYGGSDSIDLRVIHEVRQREASFRGSRSNLPGVIDSQADVGGWPELKASQPAVDSDHDGLPDTWEVQHALDPGTPDQNRPLTKQWKPTGQSIDWPTALEAYLAELCLRP